MLMEPNQATKHHGHTQTIHWYRNYHSADEVLIRNMIKFWSSSWVLTLHCVPSNWGFRKRKNHIVVNDTYEVTVRKQEISSMLVPHESAQDCIISQNTFSQNT